jgi:serine/threonine-protein kinase
VKPENILFTNGQAVLGDFGIAHVMEAVYGEATSSSGIIRGTVAYMSPEQAAGSRDCDGRSDIYSLACVLYEMITGMQAFIGPTPQSVMVQRFAHAPREVRVYRPTVPPAVETVFAKAFAMAPADRYQTARELVAALREVVTPSFSARTVEKQATRLNPLLDWRRIQFAMLVLGIVAMAAMLVWAVPQIRGGDRALFQADTTRLALFPLERDDRDAPPWRDDDLLQQGLARWRGVAVVDQFQIADALERHGIIRSTADAAAIAASLRAGRYIRGRVMAMGDGWRVSATLFDASADQPLYHSAQIIPPDVVSATGAYARLADSLLLRGTASDSVSVSVRGTRSLPAVQAFGKAQAALDDWNLALADSLFQAAVIYDTDYARANLWLAQVRAWQGRPPYTWRTVAERAAAMRNELGIREQGLSTALVSLARGAFDDACSVYRMLTRRNDRDFAAWFGLGQCQGMNRLVYPDTRSPSGWAFRSSAHRAMQAYEMAFEILPSVHRGYERGAFGRLRAMLLLTTDAPIGYGAKDSSHFYARPGWLADTLALIPYPWQDVASGKTSAIPPGFAIALKNRREAFKRIATNWSAAYPKSSGAKSAVAVALEVLGNPAAIDTVRYARELSTDPARRNQLAAVEVILLVKFGLPDRIDLLRSASRLADSLLSSADDATAANAEVLTQVAMLVGACRTAERLARKIPPSAMGQLINAGLFAESQALLARVGAGCRADSSALSDFVAGVDREYRDEAADKRASLLDIWISRPILLSQEPDADALGLLAKASQDPFYQAHWMYARGAVDSARVLFSRLRNPGTDTLTLPTPDMTYPRARLAAAIGDTAAAIARLDRTLHSVRRYDPKVLSEDMRTGPLMQAIALRADLAHARGDVPTSKRWARAVSLLWSKADAELQSTVARMESYVGLPKQSK